jgi:signal transduction histidine kinase
VTVPRLLGVVVALLLGLTALLFRTTTLRAARVELEMTVAKRTSDLAQANDELARRAARLEAKQTELAEVHALRARLIATMAHDVRTPLTMMTLEAAQLKRAAVSPEERTRIAEAITESALEVDATLKQVVKRYRDEHIELKRQPKRGAASRSSWPRSSSA